jgi:hypothetical protein
MMLPYKRTRYCFIREIQSLDKDASFGNDISIH